MVNKYYYKFNDQAQYLEAFGTALEVGEDGSFIFPKYTDVVVLGMTYEDSGEADDEGNPIMIAGNEFLVNALGTMPSALNKYLIAPPPDTPFADWQGVK